MFEEHESSLKKSMENHLLTKEKKLSELKTLLSEKENVVQQHEITISDQAERLKEAEKNKIIERISKDVLPIYQNISSKNGQALALVVNEVCTGCNMNIPPQLYNHVLTEQEILQCPSCKRILYTSKDD